MCTRLLRSAGNTINPHYAILFFVVISILFSLLYWLFLPLLEGSTSLGYSISRLTNPPVSFIDCLYFSVTTQTTVGYGDIVPISISGKICAVIQVVFGYFYLAFLVALFVSNAVIKSRKTQTCLSSTQETAKVIRIR